MLRGNRYQVAPRVGVDLVDVGSVDHSIACFGDRYLHRIFTTRELSDSRESTDRFNVESLAARFAAKEAILKVLRPVRHWFNWREIEVVRDAGGWVMLELHGAARAQAEAEGLQQFSVSLSHERNYAIAVVCGS
jgi:holo-[acyl-carrier protein] synthase